jgi:uncharacterized iron-regulated protein
VARLLAGAILLLGLGCAAPGSAPSLGPHPLAGTVLDVEDRRPVAPDALMDALASARFVVLGETHDHPEHHLVQARLVEGMVARGRKPAVVFEMLGRDLPKKAVQSEDPEELRAAVAWDASGWPDFALYAPLFRAVLQADLPVVAADLGERERDALLAESISPELRAEFGLDVPLDPEVRAALARDIEAAHCGHASPEMVSAMIRVQRARDAALAAGLVHGDAESGDGAVLIAGAEHARRDRGVPVALAHIVPDAPSVSVGLQELDASELEPWSTLVDRHGGTIPFDFVWLTGRAHLEDPCERFRESLRRLDDEGEPTSGD